MKFKINYPSVLYQIFAFFAFFINFPLFNIQNSYSVYNCEYNDCVINDYAISHGHYHNGDYISVNYRHLIIEYHDTTPRGVLLRQGASLTIKNGASLRAESLNSAFGEISMNNIGELEINQFRGGFDPNNSGYFDTQWSFNNSGNLKVNNFINKVTGNFKGTGSTDIKNLENTDSKAIFNNSGKLTSERIRNVRTANFTNDGDLKADEIINIGEPNASSETVFTNNADIHAKKINNGDGKFVNGGNITSTEIINSGHKAVYENSGNINTNILRNRNGAKFVDNGTSNIKALYNTDNGTDYRNIVKGVFDVIHNTDQAFFGNHHLLSANHIVNKAAFANGGDMSIVKWTNENGIFTNDYLAKIGKIDNKSNAKIDNLGTLQSSVIHNYDNATFENKNALISNSFTNWNGGIFFNKSGSSAQINTFTNKSTFTNESDADLTVDNFRNMDYGTIANSGNITVNNTMSLESGVLTVGGSGSFSSKILKIATLGLFQNEAGGTVTVDSITNNGDHTHGFANRGSLTANSLVNNQNAHFVNEATGSSTIKSVYNNGNMSNHGVMDVMTFNNTGNMVGVQSSTLNISTLNNTGSFANKGNLTVDKLLRNKGTFTTTDTSIINTDKFVNEEGSHFVNSGYLTADTIYNRSNDFRSYERIVSKMLSNAGKIDAVNNSKIETVSLNNLQGGIINNQNKITVSDVFVNSGSVNNGSNTGDIKSAKLLNELTGIFNNLGRLETGILHNRGKFNSTGGETILTTLQNDATGEFSNSSILYAKLINNAGNVFKNLVTGKIKIEDMNNIGKVTNAGKLEVLKSLNNGGIFEIAGGGTADIVNINNEAGAFTNAGTVNSNLFVNKSVVNNSSVLKSNKIQNEYGTFTNDGELSTDHLINKSRFDNSSTSDNNIITNIDNEQNSLFQNSGKLKVSSNFVNKGGFKNNSGTVTVSNLINEETGTIINDAGLHVEFTLINRWHFTSLSNSNISVQSLINESSGSFRNSGHVSSLNLTNKGGIGNEGTISANILHNELNSVFENKGNLNVNVEFLNRGTFSNIGTISTINLNNELNSTFENKNNLTVADKLTNKNSFINYLSGTVTTKYLENYNNYKNSGNINVTNDFVNNSNVELKETSVVNVSGGFENKNGALVSNKGSITTQSLVNRGRFENMDNSFLTVTNITNHHLSDFINRGRVSVLNNFVNNGNLSLTSDSRLSINGVYRQNGGVVNLTLNGYTTDSLIKASQMFIKNNTVLKLSTDPGFNLGVTQYVLMESDTEISFNDFGAFKGDIDGTGLGMVRWSVSLSADKKKLLLNIENVSPPLSPFPPNSVLTEEEKHLIDILSRFDTTKLKHPYLKSLVKKFQSSLISEYEKKLLAQSLTYTPANASVRVVRDNYSVIIKKILSSLNMRTTGKYDEFGISTNYLASTNDNKYYMIKDLYSLQNDFVSVNYISDSRGTDLFNESVDSFDEGSTNSESKKQKLIGLRAWADGVYSIGRYGKHGIYDEFKTNISGFVAGVDKEFLDKYTVGLSLSTSNSEVEETSFSINTMNVNLSIYSMTKFTRAYFTNILSYGFFKHNQGRSKVGDLLEARYNTYGVSFYTEYKYLLTAHIDMKGFTRFGLNKQSDIREVTKSGIGGLERNVDSIAYNDLILGYGMEYNNRIFKSGKMALIPFASFDYEYNFSHKPLNVASYFADMGPDYKFVTKTDKSNLHKFALGMGISFARSDVLNPLITKFIYSFDASSAGFANALSLKFIKSF